MKYIITSKGLALGDTVHIRTPIRERGEDGELSSLPSTGTICHIDDEDCYGIRLEGIPNVYYLLPYEFEVLQPVS